MPPRHGKSYTISSPLPAWYLGNWPDRRVMLGSHTAELSTGFGRKARDLLSRFGPQFFGVSVREDSRAADRWEVARHGGEMYSLGIGGPATGRGADLLILDDFCKNAEEALSPTYRQKAWDWYTTTWLTRKQPGASEVIVATRWHDDDLIGRRLADLKGESVRVLRLPAIAEEDDELGRAPGEALWPDKYPLARLEEIKRTQSFWFNALYQQRPTPLGGTLFRSDWFKRFAWVSGAGPQSEGIVVADTGARYLHGNVRRLMIVDPSLGQKNSDRVAAGIFGITSDNRRVCVLHMVSERIPIELIVPRLKKLATDWRVDACLMEANGFQVTLARSARDSLPCPVREIDPKGKSKLVRGTPAVELAAAGDLLVPESAPWLGEFIGELCNWTGSDGDRDDQVDVVSYAVREMMDRRSSGSNEQPVVGRPKRMAGAF